MKLHVEVLWTWIAVGIQHVAGLTAADRNITSRKHLHLQTHMP